MNNEEKRAIYMLSIAIKGLINDDKFSEAVKVIVDRNFSKEESDFFFKCLKGVTYNPRTGTYLSVAFESDSSAYLELVKHLQEEVKKQTANKK